jgi:hypothetical protein
MNKIEIYNLSFDWRASIRIGSNEFGTGSFYLSSAKKKCVEIAI